MAYPASFSGLRANLLNNTEDATPGTQFRAEAGVHAGHHNDLASAVNAIEQTLGLGPQGTSATVAERLAVIDAGVGGPAVLARLAAIDLGTDWSAGDNVDFYATNGGAGIHGQRGMIRHGTDRASVTAVGPTLKIARTGAVTKDAIEAAGSPGTDGSDQLAAIMGISRGTAAEEVQGIGVGGFAFTESTVGDPGNDACGIYGVGWATATAIGSVGIGGFFVGRRESSALAAETTGIEVTSHNRGADGVLRVTGASDTKAIWGHATGTADSAVFLQIGNPFGRQFLTGLHANSQDVGGKIGGIRDALIRDDSTALKSLWIRGTHDEGALVVERDAGFAVIGATALTSDTSQLLELHAGGTSRNPIMRITAGGAVPTAIKFNNPTGSFYLAQSGGTNNFMTGTAAADGALYVDGVRNLHFGRTGARATLRIGDNIGIGQGAADSFGGGVGVVFLANVGTRPTTVPSSGGLVYVDNGVLKYMGSSGTVTQLAAA